MDDEEGQSVSVGLWKITDVLIHQGDAVIIIGQLYMREREKKHEFTFIMLQDLYFKWMLLFSTFHSKNPMSMYHVKKKK